MPVCCCTYGGTPNPPPLYFQVEKPFWRAQSTRSGEPAYQKNRIEELWSAWGWCIIKVPKMERGRGGRKNFPKRHVSLTFSMLLLLPEAKYKTKISGRTLCCQKRTFCKCFYWFFLLFTHVRMHGIKYLCSSSRSYVMHKTIAKERKHSMPFFRF